jgi:hypothetical protein
MKYIVETISTFRMCHVVEAESESDAKLIAEDADDNFQEHIGIMHYDIQPFTEEAIAKYKAKEKGYFWDGVAYIGEDGYIGYKHPDGIVRERTGPKVK